MKEPKQKAEELVEKFSIAIERCSTNRELRECAKISVDEIIEEVRDYCDDNHHQDRMSYWQQVRSELDKL